MTRCTGTAVAHWLFTDGCSGTGGSVFTSFLACIGIFWNHFKFMWMIGCPSPNKILKSWECNFFEIFYLNEDKMSKKRYHHWTSELPDSVHDQSCLDGPNRLCMLAGIFKVQWWNYLLNLILSSFGLKSSKKCNLSFFSILQG